MKNGAVLKNRAGETIFALPGSASPTAEDAPVQPLPPIPAWMEQPKAPAAAPQEKSAEPPTADAAPAASPVPPSEEPPTPEAPPAAEPAAAEGPIAPEAHADGDPPPPASAPHTTSPEGVKEE